MFDILFARTFSIVWAMLLITAYSAYMNKSAKPMWWSIIIGVFVLLFIITVFADSFPVNLILVWLFSALIWWMMSPAIKSIWGNRKMKIFMKDRGIVLKKGESLSGSQLSDLENYLSLDQPNDEWNKIIAQAMLSTALAVFATASLVFMSDIDFSFMWMFLFISLIILIIMWFLNMLVFKSRVFSLIKAYFWVLIFTGYLIYDFNTLEKMAWDDTWAAAVHISVNIYLDIINLFLYLLEILWEG